jgi:aminoglycoside phosphotransferase (APT) family kinase protein
MRELPANLAQGLLEIAGIGELIASVVPIATGWTNENWLVTLHSGTRLVLRRYRWPHSSADLDRPVKERYLHRILGAAGVPVAGILAHVEEAGLAASLLESLPGEPLGDVSTRLSARDRADAWRSTGAALRRAHSMQYPPGTHGVIVGRRVRPEAETWGRWMMALLLGQAERLRDRHGVKLDLARLRRVAEQAVPLLDEHEPCLLHNDPHVWNVLVDDTGAGWYCSGWLDWEYAWVGDPVWDLTRLDTWRKRPIGPTPAAFWDGYGAGFAEPNYSLYLMSICLWQAGDQLTDRSANPTETRKRSLMYLADLEFHLAQLEATVARSESRLHGLSS